MRGGKDSGSFKSPLDIALARQEATHRRMERGKGEVLDAIIAGVPEQLQHRSVADPKVAREWGAALQEPVQIAMERAAQHAPMRMAGAIAPAVPRAFAMFWQGLKRSWIHRLGRFASGLGSARVWRWMFEAVWEGEPVGAYLEAKTGASEVVELQLHDLAGQRLLSSAILPGVDEVSEHDLEDPYGEQGQFLMFVGERCRLSARIIGKVSVELKASLQVLCRDLDALLEETIADSQQRSRLLPLRLQSGLSRQGPFTSTGATRRSVALLCSLAALAMVAISWVGVMEYRWQRFLEVLQEDPGIQLTSYERGWGKSSVHGLVSDRARDPSALAAAMGLNPHYIDLHFKYAPVNGPADLIVMKGIAAEEQNLVPLMIKPK